MYSWFQRYAREEGTPGKEKTPPSLQQSSQGKEALPLEVLEARIAPATVISPKAFTYTEADGDEVTVSFGQSILDGLSNEQLNQVFKFGNGDNSAADADPFTTTTAQTLREIDLSDVPGVSDAQAAKIKIEIKVKKGSPTSDGLAQVGLIRTDFDMDKIKIAGTVAKLEVGDGDASTAAAKSIEIAALGVGGVDAFGGTEGVDNLNSVIRGPVATIKVKGDIENANLVIQGPPGGEAVKTFDVSGRLTGDQASSGTVTINGSAGLIAIKGGIVGGGPSDASNAGTLTVTGSVKTLSTGSILGGNGANSGRVEVGGNIGFFGVQGDIIGGAGQGSGSVEAGGQVRKADIKGSLEGGLGDQSGVFELGQFQSMAVNFIEGGAGVGSGGIQVEGGGKTFKTKADENGNALIGGNGNGSGFFVTGDSVSSIAFGGSITAEFGSGVAVAVCDINGDGVDDLISSFTVKGGVTGGEDSSGVVLLDGFVKTFKAGAIIGGNGEKSGKVSVDSFGTVSLGPVCGGGEGSGGFETSGGKTLIIGADEFGRSLVGGPGDGSGFVISEDMVQNVTFVGGIDPGFGGGMNVAVADFDGDGVNDIVTKFTIGGTVRGGNGNSGSVMVDGFVKSFSVGNFIGGTGDTRIEMDGAGNFVIKGDIMGSSNLNSTQVIFHGDVKTISLGGARGGEITVEGDLGAFKNKFGVFLPPAIGNTTGLIVNVDGTLGPVSVGGPVTSFFLAAAGDPLAPGTPAIKSVSIKGDANGINILGGFSDLETPVNPDARVGAVKISGNVSVGNIFSGVQDSADPGQVPDEFIGGASSSLSQILNLVISGDASNVNVISAHVVAVSVGGKKFVLNSGPGNDDLPFAGVTVFEIPPP